ncbi:MAG: hypothetical protein ACOX88_06805 [Christensenellales bacterium]|jgi:hypothetical protein
MNFFSFNKRPVHAEIYGSTPSEDRVAMRADEQGRPVLTVGATQTIAASSLDIRNLSGTEDTAAITAADFAIRALSSIRDSVTAGSSTFFVTSGSATLIVGGTTVLAVDTQPYAVSAFLVRATFISAVTTVFLQLSPVTTASYFQTVASQSGLAGGGTYLLVPPMSMRYARIFATGLGSQLTAYYVGQV